MTTLAEKVAEFPADMPDWKIAEALNAPDPSLPPVVTREKVSIGPGTIMAVLGPTQGASLLDTLDAMGNSSPTMRWAMHVIRNSNLDTSMDATRAQVDALVPALLTQEQANILKALGEKSRHPSWAEHHGITVTARTVGIARGAIP